MSVRKDGEATRRKILEAACDVFGESGYRGATHAEICRRAGVNTAAINYHFGSKAELYKASWQHVAEGVERLYPMTGGVGPDAPPEDRLRGQIRAMLGRFADESLGPYHRIRMMEFSDPTGLLDEALDDRHRAHRRYTQAIVRELLGPGATETEVELCELSVVVQWRMMHPHGPNRRHRPLPVDDLEALQEHITQFSLGGILKVREARDRR